MIQTAVSPRGSGRGRPCRTCLQLDILAHLGLVLCWTGMIPVAQLFPAAVTQAFEPDWQALLIPVLAFAAATMLVDGLRLAGAVRDRLERAALLGLRIAGVGLALIVVRDVATLPFADPGSGATAAQQLALNLMHVGASAAAMVLPVVLVIIVVTGPLALIRGAPRPA